ncbi:alpha/beta fold hydrolase [Actinokineospora sp. HUAS TT18]|uniref:alpha/beta fold hydrolase n=1 Tax=Actinokineospora sp. HUAS TT18 TaxID=3447451 RepID=UPI003F521C9E
MKRLVTAIALASAFIGGLAAPAQAQAIPARNPVIFVHGYGGGAGDVAAVKPGLIAAGYADSDIHSLDFPNTLTNEDTGRRLSTVVDSVLSSTGATKVDIIGFSMGSLSSRYYIKSLGGAAKVAHFVSIAGPNHGTSQAAFCWVVTTDPGCPQMAPGSSFLTALNSGDETPGPTLHATWVSHCDDVISPPESTPLDGAVNTWTTACLTHNQTPGAPEVTSGIAQFFQGTTPPPPPPAGNLALNKPATGSTPCASTEGPAKAVNGTVSGGNSDKFCTLATSKWLQVDLGASKSITGVTVKHAQAGGEPATYNTKAFTIKTSANGSTWTTAATVTNNTAGTTTHPVTATARHVRLEITTPTQSGDKAARIYELEVTGS